MQQVNAPKEIIEKEFNKININDCPSTLLELEGIYLKHKIIEQEKQRLKK